MTPILENRIIKRGAPYILRDQFTTDLAGGSVNGTAAEPGPGTRTVAGSLIAVSGGVMTINGAMTATDKLTYASVARQAGRVFLSTSTSRTAMANERVIQGWPRTDGLLSPRWSSTDTLVFRDEAGSYQALIVAFNGSDAVSIAQVMRATGSFFFTKSGAGAWLLWLIRHTGTADAAPTFGGNASATINCTFDNIKVPGNLWLPTPLASDGYGAAYGTSDGLGHAEGVAASIGSGGSGVAWSNAGPTWAVAAAKAVNTPTLGAEQDTGALVVGTWYQITATQVDYFYAGCTVGGTFRAAATTALDANNKVKALTLTDLMSVGALACYDVLAGVAVVRGTDNRAGLCLCADSATNPQNFVLVYLDGLGNVRVDKCVAGTYTNVSTTAVTYSAGARLVVWHSGSAFRTYYNSGIVAANTISDAGIIVNTRHGLWSTSPNNTFDDFACYPVGTSNEYAALSLF